MEWRLEVWLRLQWLLRFEVILSGLFGSWSNHSFRRCINSRRNRHNLNRYLSRSRKRHDLSTCLSSISGISNGRRPESEQPEKPVMVTALAASV